jgi:hypothetical protein
MPGIKFYFETTAPPGSKRGFFFKNPKKEKAG